MIILDSGLLLLGHLVYGHNMLISMLTVFLNYQHYSDATLYADMCIRD